jgi:Domain of unknown function (DUF4266)
VLDSRSFSERLRRACCLLLLMAAGCATVRPEEKEYLAEPAMTWGDEGIAEQHEKHVLDNREGSTGAGSTSGGGCGCN